jgi:DNA-binding MarR family transcriptional regulator
MHLSRAIERAETGISAPQYRILKLAAAGGERSTRLAQRLAVAKPTLTAIADGLVAAGYAIREAEPGDRRVVRLSLTAEGRAALERADAAYAAWLDPLLAQTGQPAAVLHALGLLGDALSRERHSRHETGTGRKSHEHAS